MPDAAVYRSSLRLGGSRHADAIPELERQPDRGPRFFAVVFPHLWYPDHYRGPADWLRAHARERLRNDRVAIFEFSDAGGS